MGRNLRFYQSDRAPDYVLWKYLSIDERFPTLDDAVVLAELSRGYRPVLAEGGYLLLRKNAPLPARRLKLQFLQTSTTALGGTIRWPEIHDRATWLQAELPLSLLGRFRAFFYKPPILRAIVTDENDREINYRVTPSIARDGFIVGPFLRTPDDFAAFMRGRTRQWLHSIRFESEPGQERFWGEPTVHFFALPELKLEGDMAGQELIDVSVASPTPDSPDQLSPPHDRARRAL